MEHLNTVFLAFDIKYNENKKKKAELIKKKNKK